MDARFTEEQRLFQSTVRAFLDKECAPEQVRSAATDDWSFSRWKGLADLGIVGLTAPAEYGGLGKDETELVLLLEEAGRAALPEPLAETAAIAIPALTEFGTEDTDAWVRRCVAGEALATVSASRGAIQIRFQSRDGSQFNIATAAADLGGRTPLPFDRGAFATAAVLCGIAGRVVEMGAAYAKERHQFGKPIGSFQAVKHLLADALLGLEFARPAVYRAAWSLATGAPEVLRDVSIAKALASDAAVHACRSSLQVQGAIGYTHENDLHIWLTRGFALARTWGTAAWHRDRVAPTVLDQ